MSYFGAFSKNQNFENEEKSIIKKYNENLWKDQLGNKRVRILTSSTESRKNSFLSHLKKQLILPWKG